MPTPAQPDSPTSAPGRWNVRSGGALAAWTNSWLRGAVSYDAAVAAIHDAGISTVRGLPGHPEAVPIGWALGAVRSTGATPLRLVLPVPGDVRGVPNMPSAPSLSDAAIRAGQLVVGSGMALLPDADAGGCAAWLARELPEALAMQATPGEQQTTSQAAGALRMAVLAATDALTGLDVARWAPGVESLRHRAQRVRLPPDHEPAAAALATRCSELAAVLELAGADAPGGAVNGFGASGRDAALQTLAVAVREGLMTAYSSVAVSRTADR